MTGKNSFQLILADEVSFVGPLGSMIGGGNPADVQEIHPNKSPEKDREILEALKAAIEQAGGTLSSAREGPGLYVPMNTSIRKHDPKDIQQWIEIATYACGSTVAFAVFLRNVLGIAKDWRDLKGGRSFKVVLNGKEVTIKEGDDINELVNKHANKE